MNKAKIILNRHALTFLTMVILTIVLCFMNVPAHASTLVCNAPAWTSGTMSVSVDPVGETRTNRGVSLYLYANTDQGTVLLDTSTAELTRYVYKNNYGNTINSETTIKDILVNNGDSYHLSDPQAGDSTFFASLDLQYTLRSGPVLASSFTLVFKKTQTGTESSSTISAPDTYVTASWDYDPIVDVVSDIVNAKIIGRLGVRTISWTLRR